MLVKAVDMIMVMVTDTQRSVDWYRDVLELPVRMHHGDFAILETGNIPLALHGGAEGGAPPNRGTLAVFQVEDYASAKATLEERGCTFVFENETPQARFGTLLDPDENPIQILSRIKTS